MKNSLKQRYVYYLQRFLDPKEPLRQKWVSFWRYIGMAAGLIIEKIRHVDYAMIYQEDNGKEHCGDYTMSPKKVLRRVFDDIDDKYDKAFIDIGCGKGFAIKMASKQGFREVGGVEYNKSLYDICISNLTQERVSTKYVEWGLAQEYGKYDEFDVFYFNNPFDYEILIEVLERIHETHVGKACRCYYLNPNDEKKEEAFLKCGFKLVRIIGDPSESYFGMNVYEMK